jgi:hypothetical protein
MPGAGYNLTVHISLAQRAAAMETGIVDGMVRSVHVEESDRVPVHFGDETGARLHIF